MMAFLCLKPHTHTPQAPSHPRELAAAPCESRRPRGLPRPSSKEPSLLSHLPTYQPAFLSCRYLSASGIILAMPWSVVGFSLRNGSPPRGPRPSPPSPDAGPTWSVSPEIWELNLAGDLSPVFLSQLTSLTWFPHPQDGQTPAPAYLGAMVKVRWDCKSPLDERV